MNAGATHTHTRVRVCECVCETHLHSLVLVLKDCHDLHPSENECKRLRPEKQRKTERKKIDWEGESEMH